MLGACGLPDLRLGTAPDLAGRGIANPVATILSCAMLDHLGRTKHDDAPERAARRIELVVALAFADGRFRTADIGGQAPTKEATSAVLAHLVER